MSWQSMKNPIVLSKKLASLHASAVGGSFVKSSSATWLEYPLVRIPLVWKTDGTLVLKT